MLIQLTVQNFLLIEALSLNFTAGLTIFTGETGAGKSILFDALSFLLGARAHVDILQKDKTFCTVSAQFDIQALPTVQHWLKTHQLENASLCTLKREFFRPSSKQESRSQGFINGKIVSIKELKVLGALLITVHSQHSQQRLLKPEHQQWIVDSYGQHQSLLHEIQSLYKEYVALKHQAKDLVAQIQTRKNQTTLLQYQLDELESLALQPGEWEQLSQDQQKLAHVEHILEHGHQALALMDNTSLSALGLLHQVKQHLQKLSALSSDLGASPLEEIEQALLHTMETCQTLQHGLDTVSLDPERLESIEQRLSKIYEIARKHGITVEALPAFEQGLRLENQHLANLETTLAVCQKKQEDCLTHYRGLANELSKKRRQTKTQLETKVTEKIQTLGMEGGQFKIELIPVSNTEPMAQGQEHIEFYLSATTGQPTQLLSKSASGGELSRINLVIQAQISEKSAVPSLIFDEVDVGMSGGSAERVGQLLRHIAHTKQVFCVTHLPQVAVFGHTHYRIHKKSQSGVPVTQIEHLASSTERIQEIARILGGVHTTPQTLELAQVLLLSAASVGEID